MRNPIVVHYVHPTPKTASPLISTTTPIRSIQPLGQALADDLSCGITSLIHFQSKLEVEILMIIVNSEKPTEGHGKKNKMASTTDPASEADAARASINPPGWDPRMWCDLGRKMKLIEYALGASWSNIPPIHDKKATLKLTRRLSRMEGKYFAPARTGLHEAMLRHNDKCRGDLDKWREEHYFNLIDDEGNKRFALDFFYGLWKGPREWTDAWNLLRALKKGTYKHLEAAWPTVLHDRRVRFVYLLHHLDAMIKEIDLFLRGKPDLMETDFQTKPLKVKDAWGAMMEEWQSIWALYEEKKACWPEEFPPVSEYESLRGPVEQAEWEFDLISASRVERYERRHGSKRRRRRMVQ